MDKMNERLKDLRLEKNLNQTDFGKKIGLSKSQIACYENGSRKITDRTITTICEKFKVNEEWLRHGIGPQKKQMTPADELAYLMGMFVAEGDEFKTKIIKAMLSLEDDEWRTIEKLVDKIIK